MTDVLKDLRKLVEQAEKVRRKMSTKTTHTPAIVTVHFGIKTPPVLFVLRDGEWTMV